MRATGTIEGKSTHSFFGGVVFVLLSGVLGLWTVGPVMRESDQALVLRGALELSRSFSPFDAEFYNYDKTWLTYWLLAGVLKLTNSGSLDDLIFWGNTTAFAIGWGGVSAAVLLSSQRGWGALSIMGGCLLTPVWLLSLPLLSSNVLSAGFLGLWVVAMEWGRHQRRNMWAITLAGFCGFCAVGCRVDATLVLPALCLAWWGIDRSWSGILKEKILWVSFLGAVAAVICGWLMNQGTNDVYTAFFKWQTFGAYIFFGMGGVVFWYVGLLIYVIKRVLSGGNYGLTWIWFLVLLLPIFFYGRVLYSPRHLMIAVLVVGLSTCFSASREWFRGFQRSEAKWCYWLGLIFLVSPLFVGIELTSLRRGHVVLEAEATRYPTTDGHWPMGAYLSFCNDLRKAAERPIDHHQRVWGAWERVAKQKVPDKSVSAFSYSLSSYGALWGAWHDRVVFDRVEDWDQGEIICADDRALIRGRHRPSVSGRFGNVDGNPWNLMSRFQNMTVISEFEGGRVCLFGGQKSRDGDLFLEVLEGVREKSGGNGYVLKRLQEGQEVVDRPRSRRWMVLSGEDGEWQVFEEFPDGLLGINGQAGWYAWSELPLFFDVSKY